MSGLQLFFASSLIISGVDLVLDFATKDIQKSEISEELYKKGYITDNEKLDSIIDRYKTKLDVLKNELSVLSDFVPVINMIKFTLSSADLVEFASDEDNSKIKRESLRLGELALNDSKYLEDDALIEKIDSYDEENQTNFETKLRVSNNKITENSNEMNNYVDYKVKNKKLSLNLENNK